MLTIISPCEHAWMLVSLGSLWLLMPSPCVCGVFCLFVCLFVCFFFNSKYTVFVFSVCSHFILLLSLCSLVFASFSLFLLIRWQLQSGDGGGEGGIYEWPTLLAQRAFPGTAVILLYKVFTQPFQFSCQTGSVNK